MGCFTLCVARAFSLLGTHRKRRNLELCMPLHHMMAFIESVALRHAVGSCALHVCVCAIVPQILGGSWCYCSISALLPRDIGYSRHNFVGDLCNCRDLRAGGQNEASGLLGSSCKPCCICCCVPGRTSAAEAAGRPEARPAGVRPAHAAISVQQKNVAADAVFCC